MTAFMGAYLFWRGVSLYAGGYPNEFSLISEVQAGEKTTVTPWFYVYLVAILLSSCAGGFLQYKQLATMTESEKHPYKRLR